MSTAIALSPIPEPHRLFLQAVPGLTHYAKFRLKFRPKSERQEGIAEALAAAFVNAQSLHHRGRDHVIGRPSFVHYAVCHVLSDRHVGGRMSAKDVLSRRAQIHHGFQVRSMSVPDSDDGWKDMAVEDRRTGPAEIAALRIDFSAWLSTLSRRDRKIIGLLAAGESATHVAGRFNLSSPRISQMRSAWRSQWAALQGEAAA